MLSLWLSRHLKRRETAPQRSARLLVRVFGTLRNCLFYARFSRSVIKTKYPEYIGMEGHGNCVYKAQTQLSIK